MAAHQAEQLLHSRQLLPGLSLRPMAKHHPDFVVVQVGVLDVRCVDVSAAVAELGVKMPQLDALIVETVAVDSAPVAVLVG